MAGSFAKIGSHGAALDTAVLDQITAQMRPKARAIVLKYGVAIAGDATKRAPVASMASSGYVGGALRNSIMPASGMTGDMTYTVSDGVEYGIYQEFGTSKMPSQSFMRPAIEAWAKRFQDAFKGLFP